MNISCHVCKSAFDIKKIWGKRILLFNFLSFVNNDTLFESFFSLLYDIATALKSWRILNPRRLAHEICFHFSLKDYAEKVNEIEEDDVWNMIVDLTMVRKLQTHFFITTQKNAQQSSLWRSI